MKLETLKAACKEIYVEGDGVNVVVNTWANCEGCNLMVHGSGDGLPLRMAGAFRWEEVDAILVALTAARTA
jgi:hypothetical protein